MSLSGSPQKIGLNFVSLPKQQAGVGFLALNLFKELIPKMPKSQFVIFSMVGVQLDELKFSNSEIHAIAPESQGKKILWEQFHLPQLIKSKDINVLFNVHYTSLLFLSRKIPQVTLIPDLTYVYYFFQRKLVKSLYICLSLPFSIFKAKSVVAISKFTRSEILKLFPLTSKEKIKVMYLGPGNLIHTTKENSQRADDLLTSFNLLKEEYFIFVGTVEPTKNIYRTLQAFGAIREDYPQMKFLIVGKRGWQDARDVKFQKLMDFIALHKLKENVVFTGYVTTEDLTLLYQNARALLFASLNEGFGIPVLEAMHAEIPVITSNTSSLPEVAGKAALYVNPRSIIEIQKAMVSLLENPVLRQRLVETGIKQRERFTWVKSAESVVNLF